MYAVHLVKQIFVVGNKQILHFGVGRIEEDVRAAFVALHRRAVIVVKQPIGMICNHGNGVLRADVEVFHPGVHLYAALVGFGNEALLHAAANAVR